MKYYKSSLKLSTVCLLVLAIITSSCTKDFDERNTDPTKLTSLSPADVKSLFPSALYAGMNTGKGVDYQQAQNLFADMYTQYFASTQTAFSSDRYDVVQQWVQYNWVSTYTYAMPALYNIIAETKSEETRTLNAIARIWKVFVLHRATDYYGPIPYSEIGSQKPVVKYDAQKDIYYDFFKELTEATDVLKNSLNQPSYGVSDVIFGGDNQKWLKFANTLRLRLALRISKVEPAKAKEEAEAAYLAGVMMDNSDDAFLKVGSPNNFNGLAYISSWNEFRMSAAMESVLKGYQDPRLEKMFAPAEETGLYTGVRNGMVPAEQTLAENGYKRASNINPRLNSENMFVTPMTVMYAAEAYLLRAEAAINGWAMGGSAKELYEKGIELSLKTWGITDTGVITNYISSNNVPMAPMGYFNTPALTNIPINFSTDVQVQREQIGTQKWLALFPDGHEAWAESRRTNYPRRYPLIHSSNPDLTKDQMISRIPFLNLDKEKNAEGVRDAISLLGGPDKANTKLWWDID